MGRKKGTVEFDESSPDFDHENPYGDPVAFFEMREHIVREKWIEIEKSKNLRDRVKWCYRVEGVNHLQKCRHLVRQYLESTRGVGWGKDGRHPSLHGSFSAHRGDGVCNSPAVYEPSSRKDPLCGELHIEMEPDLWVVYKVGGLPLLCRRVFPANEGQNPVGELCVCPRGTAVSQLR